MLFRALAIYIGQLRVGTLFKYGVDDPIIRFVADEDYVDLVDPPTLSLSMQAEDRSTSGTWAMGTCTTTCRRRPVQMRPHSSRRMRQRSAMRSIRPFTGLADRSVWTLSRLNWRRCTVPSARPYGTKCCDPLGVPHDGAPSEENKNRRAVVLANHRDDGVASISGAQPVRTPIP